LILESQARIAEILVVPAGEPVGELLLDYHFNLSDTLASQPETGSQVLQSCLFTQCQDA